MTATRGKTLIERIATAVQSRKNCVENGNAEWEEVWGRELDALEKMLPSGSGLDAGCKIDRDGSSGQKVVLHTSFHHMDENGFYDGWTEHKVVITPEFGGMVRVDVKGRDRNDVKDYIADTFHWALTREVEEC